LTELLEVAPALRSSETYKYDLVDVARQVLVNSARELLPQIKAAYESKDGSALLKLTGAWREQMLLEDRLLGTNEDFLLGRWLSYVPPWSSSAAEMERLNYDARSILTTWGDRKAAEEGNLHEYGNKDWNGLVHDYYLPRWEMYFRTLSESLASGQAPKEIDWYAFGDHWNHETRPYPAAPTGDSYSEAVRVAQILNLKH
jgi:alpha-N-acetylglucosaminidase